MINSQSKYYDTKSGLYYYYHRYYDPKTGRFITEDPIGIAGGLNLYKAFGNNPVNYVDPFGEDVWIGIGVQGGFSALAVGLSGNGVVLVNTKTGEIAIIGTGGGRVGNFPEAGGGIVGMIYPHGPKCAKDFEKGENVYFESQASWGIKVFGGGVSFGRYTGIYFGVGYDAASNFIKKFVNFKKFVWVGTGVPIWTKIWINNSPEECKCKK